ncbi:hypothetical protein, partial [Burkholderia pseudomultivorans]|uniref:hypothetical protein n=1 Tax=Burkholderia pseudomultivorans TaxID=1207504 RepID=UPI0012D9079B
MAIQAIAIDCYSQFAAAAGGRSARYTKRDRTGGRRERKEGGLHCVRRAGLASGAASQETSIMKSDEVIVSFRGVRKTYDGETLVVKS